MIALLIAGYWLLAIGLSKSVEIGNGLESYIPRWGIDAATWLGLGLRENGRGSEYPTLSGVEGLCTCTADGNRDIRPVKGLSPRRRVSYCRLVGSNTGYTLYLVLLVLTIAGTLFTISVTSAARVKVLAGMELQKVQARLLAESGLERTEYFLNGGDGHDLFWETERFVEPVGQFGTIELSCLRYGAYSRVTSSGSRLRKRHVLHGLLGRDVPTVLSPVLTLTGHTGGLVIDGNTVIDGKVVLHHGAVKQGRARMPVRGFRSWTDYRESPSLPFDVTPLADFMEACSGELAAALSDTNAIGGNLTLGMGSVQTVKPGRTVVLGNCDIADAALTDARIVVAGTVTVGPRAQLSGTTVLCDRLVVEGGTTRECLFYCGTVLTVKGGVHNSQFFSADSILVPAEVLCGPLSVWVSRRTIRADSTLSGGVFFGDCATITGHVVCFTDTTGTRRAVREGPSVRLGNVSRIKGTVVTDGDIDMQRVEVKGHLWARSVATLRDKTTYVNWLFDCRLGQSDEEIIFPLVGEAPARVRLVDGARGE